METFAGHYRGGETLDFAAARAFTASAIGAMAGSVRIFDRQLFDTADGLLRRAGLALAFDHPGSVDVRGQDRGRLSLINLATDAPMVSVAADKPPRFAADLEAGPFTERLARLVSVRALLPFVRLSGKWCRFAVRDGNLKTVARVVLAETGVGAGDQKHGEPLTLRLWVEPLRGYGEAATAVHAALGGLPVFIPLPKPFHDAMFAQASRIPGLGMPRGLAEFPPDLAAGAAARLILRHHLDVMEANEYGIVDDIDTEFLHDYRIALRRSRTALSAFRRLLPTTVLALKEDMRWLGGVTSMGRDMDVYLLDFSRLAALVPEDLRGNLDVAEGLIRRHRAEAYDDLRQILATERYAALKRQWREGLVQPPLSAAEFRPIRLEANRRIRKLFEKTRNDGLAITSESPPEALHDLRKTAKKLRYVVEFFAGFYPPGEIRKFLKTLKRLQGNLGLHQDLEVQRAFVLRLLDELSAEGQLSAGAKTAMESLAATLHDKQLEERGKFASAFAGFASEGYDSRVRAMFSKSKGASIA